MTDKIIQVFQPPPISILSGFKEINSIECGERMLDMLGINGLTDYYINKVQALALFASLKGLGLHKILNIESYKQLCQIEFKVSDDDRKDLVADSKWFMREILSKFCILGNKCLSINTSLRLNSSKLKITEHGLICDTHLGEVLFDSSFWSKCKTPRYTFDRKVIVTASTKFFKELYIYKLNEMRNWLAEELDNTTMTMLDKKMELMFDLSIQDEMYLNDKVSINILDVLNFALKVLNK